MSKLWKFIAAVGLVGLILGILSLGDTILLIKGDTVNLNDPLVSFDDKALVQGDIDFVYGPFATLEESQTRYGVTTSKTETDFFIVGNVENGEGFVVLSTSHDSMRKELVDASDKWIDWFSSDDEDEPMPEIKISFKGKLAKQYKDDDYNTFYEEAIDDLTNIGIEKNEYGTLRIIEGEVSTSAMTTCFVGFGIFLVIAVLFIAVLLKQKKQSQIDEY